MPTFTLGARPEFEARQQGFAGLQSVYRLTNGQFVPIAADARFVALDEGDVDASNVFSTDPQLATGRLPRFWRTPKGSSATSTSPSW